MRSPRVTFWHWLRTALPVIVTLLAARSKTAWSPVATWSFETTVTGPAQSICLIVVVLRPGRRRRPALAAGGALLVLVEDGHGRAAHGGLALHHDDVALEHRPLLLVEHVEAVGVDLDRLLAVAAEIAERPRGAAVLLAVLGGGSPSRGSGGRLGGGSRSGGRLRGRRRGLLRERRMRRRDAQGERDCGKRSKEARDWAYH